MSSSRQSAAKLPGSAAGGRVLTGHNQRGKAHPDPSICAKTGKGADCVPISGLDLSAIIGVLPQTVSELAAQGRLVRLQRGRYDRDGSIRRYCEHLREVAAGRGGESAVASLTAERARLARGQADGVAMKNAALRGEMVPACEVTARWREVFTGVRSRILAVPSRVRAALPHLSVTEAAAIEREIRSALEDASNGSA